MEPLRIGVLGAARISGLAIAGPARTTGDRLVAVAARDRSRAEAFAATHGVERVARQLRRRARRPRGRGRLQPAGQQPPRPLEPGRRRRRPARADREAVGQQRHRGRRGPRRRRRGRGDRPGGASTTSTTRSPAACWSCSTPASSASCGGSRSTPSSPPPPTATPAGRWSWPAAPSWTSAATPSTPTASSPPGPAAHPASSRPAAASAPATPASTNGWRPSLEFPNGATGTARCNMAGDRDRWPFRIVGTRGEATAANFVQPHIDDRVLVSTEARRPGRGAGQALLLHLPAGSPPGPPPRRRPAPGGSRRRRGHHDPHRRLLPKRGVRPPPPRYGLSHRIWLR